MYVCILNLYEWKFWLYFFLFFERINTIFNTSEALSKIYESKLLKNAKNNLNENKQIFDVNYFFFFFESNEKYF